MSCIEHSLLYPSVRLGTACCFLAVFLVEGT